MEKQRNKSKKGVCFWCFWWCFQEDVASRDCIQHRRGLHTSTLHPTIPLMLPPRPVPLPPTPGEHYYVTASFCLHQCVKWCRYEEIAIKISSLTQEMESRDEFLWLIIEMLTHIMLSFIFFYPHIFFSFFVLFPASLFLISWIEWKNDKKERGASSINGIKARGLKEIKDDLVETRLGTHQALWRRRPRGWLAVLRSQCFIIPSYTWPPGYCSKHQGWTQ